MERLCVKLCCVWAGWGRETVFACLFGNFPKLRNGMSRDFGTKVYASIAGAEPAFLEPDQRSEAGSAVPDMVVIGLQVPVCDARPAQHMCGLTRFGALV